MLLTWFLRQSTPHSAQGRFGYSSVPEPTRAQGPEDHPVCWSRCWGFLWRHQGSFPICPVSSGTSQTSPVLPVTKVQATLSPALLWGLLGTRCHVYTGAHISGSSFHMLPTLQVQVQGQCLSLSPPGSWAVGTSVGHPCLPSEAKKPHALISHALRIWK